MTTHSKMLADSQPVWLLHVNRNAGCFLLLAALASVVCLAAWPPVAKVITEGSHAPTMIAALAIVQLGTFELLRTHVMPLTKQSIAGWLTALGSLAAALGYVLSAPLILIGALFNLAGYLVLITRLYRRAELETIISFAMICFGMSLIAAMALHDWQVTHTPIVDLGPNDGFTLRALRLARVAAVVLPVLSFLYEGLSSESKTIDPVTRFGRWAILWGVLGMAPILFASGLIFSYLKVLLVIPSLAIFGGVLCGLLLSRRQAPPLETSGWLLIAISMAGGLLMGLYAFADPWVAFQFPGEYNDYPRRLIRLAHVGCVFLGLAAIFLSRNVAPVVLAGNPTRRILKHRPDAGYRRNDFVRLIKPRDDGKEASYENRLDRHCRRETSNP